MPCLYLSGSPYQIGWELIVHNVLSLSVSLSPEHELYKDRERVSFTFVSPGPSISYGAYKVLRIVCWVEWTGTGVWPSLSLLLHPSWDENLVLNLDLFKWVFTICCQTYIPSIYPSTRSFNLRLLYANHSSSPHFPTKPSQLWALPVFIMAHRLSLMEVLLTVSWGIKISMKFLWAHKISLNSYSVCVVYLIERIILQTWKSLISKFNHC